MWHIPYSTNRLVVIAPHTTFLACMWIQKGTHALFSIAAYKQYICTHFQIGRGILFNPTWVQHSLADFLNRYALNHSYIAIMPDRVSIPHGFIELSDNFVSDDIASLYTKRHAECGFDYLCTSDEYKHLYYWYQIPRSLLLQYQCICIAGALNCIRITPRFCALLHAYKAVHAAAFRRTQLYIDLKKANNSMAHYFTNDSINRLVSDVPVELYSDKQTLVDIIAAAGIAYLHQDYI
ncbi:MAG TPA: hypothetical protein VGW78_06120 [Candidatus Babeliales bacterium]|jgi:hypothetical protein|nr:hypothetical protein [Candidatus Babeliales bacterium]